MEGVVRKLNFIYRYGIIFAKILLRLCQVSSLTGEEMFR